MNKLIQWFKQLVCLHGGDYQGCFIDYRKGKNGKPQYCFKCGKVFK